MDTKSKISILIVDDEKSNLDILVYILKPLYTIYIARNGREALKRANEDKPDLILLDIILPDMSGFEVLTELKASIETQHIPVICITALDNIDDEEKGLTLGAVDYITKPFHHPIVKARVKTHIQIVQQMNTIQRLGMIDALTEIPNRRSFDINMNMEWGRAARDQNPVSLLIIDIDDFKKYNDTYGHSQGDIVLRSMARLFVSMLKRPADMAARWGGEEFIILLPNTSLEGALDVAEKIRAGAEVMEIPGIWDKSAINVTVSIGVSSTMPRHGDPVLDFIQATDKALYTAKNTGKNRVCS